MPRTINWLEAAGFEVRWVRSLQLQRSHIDGLWERLIPTISRRRVDVVAASLTAGPSALLGVRHSIPHVDATGHLHDLKGSADPLAREEWSLRSHLGAPNILTSLVHTPDTPQDLLRELRLLLPQSDEQEFWHAMEGGGSPGGSLPPDLSGDDPPPPITALIVSLRLRARLLARLLDGASGMFADVIGAVCASVNRDLTVAEQSDPFDPLTALARYRATFEPQRERLRRAAGDDATIAGAGEGRALACGGYAQLESMAAGEPCDLDLLIAGLEGAGVVPGTWERIVLASEWATPAPQPCDRSAARRQLETPTEDSRL